MAKKTYRTYSLKGLHLLLPTKWGNTIEVRFKSGCRIDSTAKFTTSDEKLQNVLESCSSFGRDFYIENVREEKPVENENHNENENVAEEATVVEDNGVQKVEVADKSDAIEWLKEHNPEAGYTAAKLRSKEAFEKACKENNVEFIFN